MVSSAEKAFRSGSTKHIAAALLLGFSVGCVANNATSRQADADSGDTIPTAARLSACGGDVAFMGRVPEGAFKASYVFVERCDGDCNSLVITVADGTSAGSLGFSFVLSHGGTGVFLGPQTVEVLVQRAGQATWTVVGGSVDVTVADPPGLPTTFGAPPFGQVAGTLSVTATGIDLSGTFSSPVCSSRLSV